MNKFIKDLISTVHTKSLDNVYLVTKTDNVLFYTLYYVSLAPGASVAYTAHYTVTMPSVYSAASLSQARGHDETRSGSGGCGQRPR